MSAMSDAYKSASADTAGKRLRQLWRLHAEGLMRPDVVIDCPEIVRRRNDELPARRL